MVDFKDLEEIDRRFSINTMAPAKTEHYQAILHLAQDLAYQIVGICPENRERSQAMTDLDNCLLHVRVAIERGEMNGLEEICKRK